MQVLQKGAGDVFGIKGVRDFFIITPRRSENHIQGFEPSLDVLILYGFPQQPKNGGLGQQDQNKNFKWIAQ